jgi:hypothetical protein
MKQKFISFFILLILTLSIIPGLLAGISAGTYAAGVGRYLWRGQLLDDSYCIQPGVSLGFNKFTFDWWGSYGINLKELTESDYRVSFSDTVPFVPLLSLSSGFWIYTYPFRSAVKNNSQEIFGALNLNVPSQPNISFYYDPVLGRGGYAELGFSHEIEINGFGVNAAGNAGYNFGQRGFSPSLTAVTGTLGLSYSFAGFKITPAYIGQYALNKQYKSLSTWSINLSYEFGILEDSKASLE